MRPSSLALLFELPEILTASSPPAEPNLVSFRRLSPRPEEDVDDFRSGAVKNRHRHHPCCSCNCKRRQTHPAMEEHEIMCCKYDSYGEVSRLMIKAYTLAFLLLAAVVLWTAGDVCLYFGFSYLDNRYRDWNSHIIHQGSGSNAGFGCWTGSCLRV